LAAAFAARFVAALAAAFGLRGRRFRVDFGFVWGFAFAMVGPSGQLRRRVNWIKGGRRAL